MQKLLVLLASVCAASAAPKWHQLDGYTFEKYVSDFGKFYDEATFQVRKTIFEEKLSEI